MVAPYPNPNVNDTGFFGLASYTNTITDGFFWLIMLLIMWVVVFVNTIGYRPSRAFTLASFLTGVSSIILAILDLISPTWMYLLIVFIAIGALWMKFEE